MRLRGVLAVGVVALVAVGCSVQPPPPPDTPEGVLASYTAGTRFAHVRPSITLTDRTDGMSTALCPSTIIIGVPESDSIDFEWTLVHEWAHLIACPNGYAPPVDFPRTVPPSPWKWDGRMVWDWENWADCVAEALTGHDGSHDRDYPECTDAQDRWTENFLDIQPETR